MNRLDSSLSRNATQTEASSSAKSRIKDLNFAEEIVHMSTRQIAQQASLSAMAQSNVMSQAVLQLLN